MGYVLDNVLSTLCYLIYSSQQSYKIGATITPLKVETKAQKS